MGRSRRLLGTKPILVRISEELAQELDSWAEQEGVSRNTLLGRELATMVMERKRQNEAKPVRILDSKPSGTSSLKRGASR